MPCVPVPLVPQMPALPALPAARMQLAHQRLADAGITAQLALAAAPALRGAGCG